MKTKYLLLAFAPFVMAEDTYIVGNVESKCVINTDTYGVYGNPTVGKLSTLPADGGVMPVIRYDVITGDAYTARITIPSDFSTSPILNDRVVFDGSVSVKEVSDSAMSDYDTNKVEYDYTTEFNMHTAGTTWFKVDSNVLYGYNKAFPAGEYRSVVNADCIAK